MKGLGGQGDLGDQDDGLFVAVDELLEAMDVDFGLAGTGYAVEQLDGEAGVG